MSLTTLACCAGAGAGVCALLPDGEGGGAAAGGEMTIPVAGEPFNMAFSLQSRDYKIVLHKACILQIDSKRCISGNRQAVLHESTPAIIDKDMQPLLLYCRVGEDTFGMYLRYNTKIH